LAPKPTDHRSLRPLGFPVAPRVNATWSASADDIRLAEREPISLTAFGAEGRDHPNVVDYEGLQAYTHANTAPSLSKRQPIPTEERKPTWRGLPELP